MELNDNEFDAAFRKKVFDADPEFEEEAWNKMEQKLKRRDRLVFFKKSAIACVLLFAVLGGYYTFEKNPLTKTNKTLVSKNKNKNVPVVSNPITGNKNIVTNQIATKKIIISKVTPVNSYPETKITESDTSGKQLLVLNNKADDDLAQLLPDQVSVINPANELSVPEVTVVAGDRLQVASDVEKKNVVKSKKAMPLSFALNVGPEFNSANSLVGGKTGFTAGLTLSVGIAKKLSLQTGIKYSIKDYDANGYSYKFSSPNLQNLIANVNAECSVLEIPVLASYTIANNQQRSIDLNAGISSYIMLKENYTFNYNPESGKQDYLLRKTNENQHLFSVIDLSATYFIKLKKDNLKLGLEPFIKIPLTGIGEGMVNLKSSGISLKIRYDLDK